MIEYSKTKADNKNRIKEMTWMKGRIFVYIGLVALPLMIFFLLVGILGKIADALNISRSYVSRIEKKALEKLKDYLQKSYE